MDNVNSIPSEYSISPLSLGQQHFVYSEDQDSGDVAIEGQVRLKIGMVANQNDPSYRAITEQRFRVANDRSKYVEAKMVKDEVTKIMEDNTFKKPLVSVKEVREKRERLPKENLLVLIFEAYKKKDAYSLQELNKIVDQPDGYLKEVLNEIATQQREEKVMVWRLKPGMLVRKDNMMEVEKD